MATQPCWTVSVVSSSYSNPEAGKIVHTTCSLALLASYNKWSELGPSSKRVAVACSSEI